MRVRCHQPHHNLYYVSASPMPRENKVNYQWNHKMALSTGEFYDKNASTEGTEQIYIIILFYLFMLSMKQQ